MFFPLLLLPNNQDDKMLGFTPYPDILLGKLEDSNKSVLCIQVQFVPMRVWTVDERTDTSK